MQFSWMADLRGQTVEMLYFGGVSSYSCQYRKSNAIG